MRKTVYSFGFLLPISTIYRCPGLYIYDKLVVKFGFPYSPTACLRPHNLVHVPTPAYGPKGNAYIHNDQCQPPDKSFCLSKNLCSNGLDLKVLVSNHIVVMIMKTYQRVIVRPLANNTHNVHFACVILARSGNCYTRSQPCRALGDREVGSSSTELLFTSSSTCASLFFLKFLPILGHSLGKQLEFPTPSAQEQKSCQK